MQGYQIGLICGLVPIFLIYAYRFYYRKGWLVASKTEINEEILKRCPLISSKVFNPTVYLQNRLMQTVMAGLLPARGGNVEFIINEVTMPGGGHTSLAWAQHDGKYKNPHQEKVLVVIIPGLTGSVKDNYVKDLAGHLQTAGYRCVVYQPRFNGGKLILPDEGYLDIVKDFKITMDHVRQKEKGIKLIGIGHSYGANLLVNYLGFNPDDNGFAAGISIANPFNLMLGEAKLRGSLTDRALTKFLQRTADSSRKELSEATRFNFNLEDLQSYKTVRDFDKSFTIKVYGFETVNDYYWGISSCRRVTAIKTPLLMLQAEDDPVVEANSFDKDELEKKAPNLILLMTPAGGHQGWVEGFFVLKRWYMKPVVEYINALVDVSKF